jgi:amidohydrolase family protein
MKLFQRTPYRWPLLGMIPTVSILWTCFGGSPMALAQTNDLAIVGGTVIDGTGAPARPSTTIIVSGGRIVKIGPSATTTAPAGARVISAVDKFVLPGLWDSHIHYRDYYAELLITHGITSFVDWGGSPMDWTLAQKDAINKGEMYGPRIFTAGEMVRDDADPEAARRQVRELKARGVDMISVGFDIRKDSLLAVIDEARKVGLPSSGYPLYTRAAIEAGMNAIKHTYTVGSANITDPARFADLEKDLKVREMSGHDARKYLLDDDHDDLVRLMVQKKIVWVPTLLKDFKVTHDRRNEFELENFHLLANPNLQYLPVANLVLQLTNDFPTGISEVASGNVGTVDRTGADWELYRKAYKNLQDLIKKLANGGVHVLAGTAPHSFVLPGISLHQELQLLVDAGMTPMQAIQAATLWPAEFMRTDKDLGSVAEGKVADLVVLSKNPLDDIRNTRSVETVIQGGRVQPTGYHWWYTNPLQRTGAGAPGEGPRPPQLDAVSPATLTEGSKDITVSFRGKGFIPASAAFFERFPLETTYVSSTELRAILPSRFARSAGVYYLRVRTPKPGGGDSAMVPFTVRFP